MCVFVCRNYTWQWKCGQLFLVSVRLVMCISKTPIKYYSFHRQLSITVCSTPDCQHTEREREIHGVFQTSDHLIFKSWLHKSFLKIQNNVYGFSWLSALTLTNTTEPLTFCLYNKTFRRTFKSISCRASYECKMTYMYYWDVQNIHNLYVYGPIPISTLAVFPLDHFTCLFTWCIFCIWPNFDYLMGHFYYQIIYTI